MKTNQKGVIQIVLVVGILIAIGVIGFVMYNQKQLKDLSSKVTNVPDAYKSDYQQSSDEVTLINDSEDLTIVDTTLETSNTTEIETELKSLDSDLAAF